MKKKLTDNLGLKIFAVLCSVLLWLIVMNIDDPVKPYTFRNIPVEIINQQVLTDEGKVFEVLDGTNVVDVTVYAKRSILGTIGRDNIVAVADMSEITFMNTVRIKLSTDKYNEQLESITASEENLKLSVEDLKRVQMVVETVIAGEPGEGYMVSDVTSEQNLVRLSGAESVISKVDRAVLEVSVEGITTGIQADYPIKLYDVSGNEIDSSNITKSISNIGVKVSVLQKKQVPFEFQVTGTPADGYAATGVVTSNPESVLIAGGSNALKNVSAIEIPAGILDINGASGDVVVLADIRDYLPEGIILADTAFNGRVSVTVTVEAEQTAKVELKPEEIEIRNLPEGMKGEVTAAAEVLTVDVKGLAQYMGGIEGTTVTGYVDAAALIPEGANPEAGVYQVPVIVSLPEGIKVKGEPQVTLTIEEDKQEEMEE